MFPAALQVVPSESLPVPGSYGSTQVVVRTATPKQPGFWSRWVNMYMRNKHTTSTVTEHHSPIFTLQTVAAVASPQALRRRFVAPSACSATWHGQRSVKWRSVVDWISMARHLHPCLRWFPACARLVSWLFAAVLVIWLIGWVGWLFCCGWLVVHKNQCCSIQVVLPLKQKHIAANTYTYTVTRIGCPQNDLKQTAKVYNQSLPKCYTNK